MLAAAPAGAQLPIAPSTQFDVTGFIEEATLGAGTSGLNVGPGAGAHQGGIIKVNGHVIIVPSETIVILPANALTWQELFARSPAPYTGVATGMALADLPAPLTTYEAHVVGNRVLGGTGGADVYIAGLVNISQQALNSGQGFVNFMDYTLGEMRIGGVLNDPTTGTRVRLNDPVGRFGRTMGPLDPTPSPDARFAVDDANPTIISGTGFPMCFPRVAPPAPGGAETDALCPQGNRPAGQSTIQMNDPTALPGVLPDATKQAPFEVGDYVTFAGTLVRDGTTPTAGPWPGIAATYVSAHTITNNIAVYTWPGTNPAYAMIDVSLIGTGGLNVLGAQEAAVRTRFEGMTTDPSRNIHLYGIDLAPATGATADRDWGTIGVDPGPPTGAVKGRWRFRPPCTATIATAKACTPPPAGTFLPPTREVRAVVEGLQSQNPANVAPACVPPAICAVTAANGLFYGQYHAPIATYIFPENIPGTPIIENNFNAVDFLAKGGYSSSTGVVAGVLNPWPSNVNPAPVCTPPTVDAGGPYTVASGGTVTLAATVAGSPVLSLLWATPSAGSLSSATIASPVYTAPSVAVQTVVPLSLTVTQVCNGVTSSVTATSQVTVNAAAAPTINHIPPQTVVSGQTVTMTASGTDPGGLALTFSFLQTAGPIVLVPNPRAGATQTFTAPTAAQCPPTSLTLAFTVTATNSAGVASAPEFTTVTVNPLADAVAIPAGGTEFRTSRQRLTVNATSSLVCGTDNLTLQPYQCQTVAGQVACPPSGIYNPDPAAGGVGNAFTNNGNGTYIITLVGAPPPLCNSNGTFATPCPALPLTVNSNLGGTSAPHGLDRIRQ